MKKSEEIKVDDIKKVMNEKGWFFFDFDESNKKNVIQIQKEKINFIYSNNGVGKTTIHNVLTSNEVNNIKFKYESFNPNINSFLEKSDVIRVEKNIGLIKKNENEIKEIEKQIKEGTVSFLQKYKFSSGNKIWTDHIKPFLKETECTELTQIMLPKQISKTKKESFNPDIKKIFKELDEVLSDYSYDINYEWTDLKNFKKKYSDLIKEKDDAVNSIEIIKKDVLKKCNKKNIWDCTLLNCILDCINDCKLSEMPYCYICENKNMPTTDIDSIKELISKKIGKSDSIDKFITSFNIIKVGSQNLRNKNDINVIFDCYVNRIKSWIYEFSMIFKKEELEKIEKNEKEIEKLKKEKELAKINSNDLAIIKKIFKNTIGDEINLNYEEDKFLYVRNEKKKYDEPLPFSKGEEKLIKFIMHLVVFISDKSIDVNNTFLVIDEIDELFDELNKVILGYIINMFSKTYKVNFLILTNKTTLINNFSYIFKENQISLTLFCKQINGKRKFISATKDEIDFLSFKKGKFNFKTNFNNIIQGEKLSEYEKVIFLIYINWLFRIDQPINKRQQNKNSFEFLKYNFLFKSNSRNEKIFQKSKTKIKNTFFNNKNNKNKSDNSNNNENSTKFENKFNLEHKNFVIIIENMCKDFEKIQLPCLIKKNVFLIENNIKNLVKTILIREKLRMKMDYFFKKNKNLINEIIVKVTENENSSYKEYTSKGDYLLLLTKIIFQEEDDISLFKANEFKEALYLFSVLDNFIHTEDNPALILKGIELNDYFLNNLNNQQENLNFEKLQIVKNVQT